MMLAAPHGSARHAVGEAPPCQSVASVRPLRFNMARKVIENGLPAVALLLDRMRCFTVEGDPDLDTTRGLAKFDLGCAITKAILNQLVLDQFGVGTCKIKAHAAILCLHARREGTAHAQVDRGSGCVPVIGRSIPLLDVFRC